MFLLSRRQTRTALAAGAGAAVYLAASELGKDKLKLTGLFVLASASMAGMVTAKASAKAYSAHHRIDQLVPTVNGKYDKTGGTVSGSVTVTGNHTVQGTLLGSAGTIDVGDIIDMNTNSIVGAQTVTLNGVSNLQVSNGGVGLNGNLSMNSNNLVNGGSLSASSTTGGTAQGSAPATYSQSSLQACINRVNDFIAALG